MPPLHLGEGLPAFDCARVPLAVVHAWHDELIPARGVVDFCEARAITLHLVDDTHRLSNHVETIYIPTRAAHAGGSYEVTNSTVEPGTGEMNYQNIFKVLHSKGYKGIIGLEHSMLKPGMDGFRKVVDSYRLADAFSV